MKQYYCSFSGVLFAVFLWPALSMGQSGNALGYQMRYDDPYDINKLFVQFIPLYGEVSGANMTIGFGFELDYYLENKFDFNLQARRPYSQRSDIMRDAAEKNNSNANSNRAFVYNYLEFGGTYHYRDFEQEKTSNVYLYARKYKGDALETHVMQTTEIMNKVRKPPYPEKPGHPRSAPGW